MNSILTRNEKTSSESTIPDYRPKTFEMFETTDSESYKPSEIAYVRFGETQFSCGQTREIGMLQDQTLYHEDKIKVLTADKISQEVVFLPNANPKTSLTVSDNEERKLVIVKNCNYKLDQMHHGSLEISKVQLFSRKSNKISTNKDKTLATNSEYRSYSQKQNEVNKFLNAISLTNKDIERKSGILIQKQNLVNEFISYVHAVQSILRLSTPSKSMSTRGSFSDSVSVFSPNSRFYEAGEHILNELRRYLDNLLTDFTRWEDYRKRILDIYEKSRGNLEICEDKLSVKILMHEITVKICDILKEMEGVSSKREEENEDTVYLMEGVDTYIKYSSSFIMT